VTLLITFSMFALQVFEICHELELLRCFKPAKMRTKINEMRQCRGLKDEINELIRRAEAAIIATGDRLMYPESGWSDQQGRDPRIFPLCSSNPKQCIAVVRLAHELAKIVAVEKELLNPKPDGSNEDFQTRVLSVVWGQTLEWLNDDNPSSALHHALRENYTAARAALKQYVDEQVALLTEELLGPQGLKRHKKKKLLCYEDEPDENDSDLLKVMQKKLELSTKLEPSIEQAHHTKASKAWRDLCTSKFEHDSDWTLQPGFDDFNEQAQAMMKKHHVPHSRAVFAPGKDPCVQPYQETLSYLVHPKASPTPKYAAQRMLVVHRTGAGKTCSMIRVADNFFGDRRPKILLFPSPAVRPLASNPTRPATCG
jgi:hypothetical protein